MATKKTELTTSEARAFYDRIWPAANFLYRCRVRLEQLKFDRECTLYKEVDRAYDALRSLTIELHSQSVADGMGRPPKDE
jgi:hypothetical protein